jgi:hypothetical protein
MQARLVACELQAAAVLLLMVVLQLVRVAVTCCHVRDMVTSECMLTQVA